MLNYTSGQKDPEEILPQIAKYTYPHDIVSFDVVIKDSTNNVITNAILRSGSIVIDNTTKSVSYYIQGGTDGLQAKVRVIATFDDGVVLEDNYSISCVRLREKLTKKVSENIPLSVNYQDKTPLKQNILSYTIFGYINGVSNNSIITSSSMANNKVSFSVGMGSIGDRMEVVLKTLCADNITLLVDRFYIDVR